MAFENKYSRKPKKNVYEKTKNAPEEVKNTVRVPRANVRLQKDEEQEQIKEEAKAFEVNPNSPFLKDSLTDKSESDYEKKAKAAIDKVVLSEGIVYNSSTEQEKVERINYNRKKENKNSDKLAENENSAESLEKLEAFKQAMTLSENVIKEEKQEKEKNIEESMNKLTNNEEEQVLNIVSDRTKKKEPMYVKFTALRAVGLCFIVFISLGTFFGIGLVVGRDMQAKVNPVELASIIPTKEETLEKKEDVILKAEELEFSKELKSADRDALAQAEETQKGQAESNSITPYPISDPVEVALQEAKAKEEEIKKAEDSTIYDYVVRTATFKAENKATTFSKKLIANNLRGEVVRGANWYFVNVKFRGTPKNFEEMKSKLLKLGIDDSIILSKEALQLG